MHPAAPPHHRLTCTTRPIGPLLPRLLGVIAVTAATACGGASTIVEDDETQTETLTLYDCSIEPDCVQDTGHLGEGPTPEQQRCGGEVLHRGEGAVLVTSNPGPYPTLIERLVVLTAEGAYQQSRSRCAEDGACEGQNTAAWRYEPLGACQPATSQADLSGCDDPNGTCTWTAYAEGCVEVAADWTCADVAP